MPVYLDHNATTPLDPRVLEAMRPYLEGPYANASSLHRYGRAARDAVEAARAQVAALVGARPAQLIFTSGGTEADNLAVKGMAGLAPPTARLLYAATEHPAVLETAESLRAHGRSVEVLPVDGEGRLQLEALDAALAAAAPVALVAVMAANNETGVIQPIEAVAARTGAAGVPLLIDAVQAAGRLPLDFVALGAGLMSLSAHKIYGPRGCGALVVDEGIELEPLLHGGGQEKGRRGGTENLAAIVGFGAAAELALAEREARNGHVEALRNRLEDGLGTIAGSRVFGAGAARLPNTIQFSVPGWEGEALLMALDRRGFAVSSGSACHSGRGQPSHVLLAMGVPREIAMGAVRVSFGVQNSAGDVDALLGALRDLTAQVGVA
jgi:Cysteine sulfinate desulfinase/cysteine desulfurase and related enzymes